jgi:hypothetical protein
MKIPEKEGSDTETIYYSSSEDEFPDPAQITQKMSPPKPMEKSELLEAIREILAEQNKIFEERAAQEIQSKKPGKPSRQFSNKLINFIFSCYDFLLEAIGLK